MTKHMVTEIDIGSHKDWSAMSFYKKCNKETLRRFLLDNGIPAPELEGLSNWMLSEEVARVIKTLDDDPMDEESNEYMSPADAVSVGVYSDHLAVTNTSPVDTTTNGITPGSPPPFDAATGDPAAENTSTPQSPAYSVITISSDENGVSNAENNPAVHHASVKSVDMPSLQAALLRMKERALSDEYEIDRDPELDATGQPILTFGGSRAHRIVRTILTGQSISKQQRERARTGILLIVLRTLNLNIQEEYPEITDMVNAVLEI